ncbi:hypothetical protein FOXYSP1_19863 [Fusarium oxysporum f. sp. phaseoli]
MNTISYKLCGCAQYCQSAKDRDATDPYIPYLPSSTNTSADLVSSRDVGDICDSGPGDQHSWLIRANSCLIEWICPDCKNPEQGLFFECHHCRRVRCSRCV